MSSQSSCCSLSTPTTSLTRTRTRTTTSLKTTTPPLLGHNSNGGWISTRKRGRDDSDIEEARKLARQRRKEELAAASPAAASASASPAASTTDKRRTRERRKYSDCRRQDHSSDGNDEKKKRSISRIDKVEDDDARKTPNAGGRRIFATSRKKKNNIDINKRNLQIYSPNLGHRRRQQQDPTRLKRTKISPKVLIFHQKYTTSAKHFLETQRRGSKSNNNVLSDLHHQHEKRQNDDGIVVHNSHNDNLIKPSIEETSTNLKSCFVSKDSLSNDHRRTDNDDDHDHDHDRGIESITENVLDTQEAAGTSADLQPGKAGGPRNDFRTKLKFVDHYQRRRHDFVDNHSTKNKNNSISYIPDHEHLPGTQDFDESNETPATIHHCNLKKSSNQSSRIIHNPDQRPNDCLIENNDDVEDNNNNTEDPVASKSNVEDELDETGTMDQTCLSLPLGNGSCDESDSESDSGSDSGSSDDKALEPTYGSVPATQEQRYPIPCGQLSYDEELLSQNITKWLGQYHIHSSDHNNSDDEDGPSRTTQNHNEEKSLLDPLTNQKFWENLVEDERKERKCSYKNEGSVVGNMKFRSAIAKLVVAKNDKIQTQNQDSSNMNKTKKKRRNENRLLWLPSILDGGLTGVWSGCEWSSVDCRRSK
mmetsp:Transcript_39527/g.95513  ORF Transcript_39527/g.95513 Transcript_39527/m.95513 type:complete len:647 (-) Transcript_39527:44-1984(-)